MSQEDQKRWNKKYQNSPIPNTPIKLVTSFASQATKGYALDVACGMGRHSRYLASLGFEVDALDISSVAIASLQNIPHVHPIEVDFDSYRLTKNYYDLIISTFFLNRELFPQMIEALKIDGILIYETFVYHPDNDTAPSNRSFLLEEGELMEAFDGLCEIVYYEEYWTKDMKGNKSMKASMVARKR
ncbi:MAG: methyltransferase domain-containing protein [Campylobacterota bacterium]|nr:methyltransferase domain-containing protein [Campylobacterota bacterium]